mmetsp:Transcript_25453/g.28275  ORF Transcript_25453/g.28275 Transcript_25453/m.28275 type:complete len:262 (+) Transcript_25453:31-816(+)
MFLRAVRTGLRARKGLSRGMLRSPRAAFSSALPQHRDTPDNNASTPFDWTPESKERIATVLAKFPSNYKNSGCLPLLWIAQEQNDNFLTLSAMNKVAEELDMPPIRVYETATFYTMYNRTKVGKYHIQLCGTTPCMLCGAEDIKKTIEEFANIKEGETSEDGLFTLSEVECLGACVNAPMIQVNNQKFYEFLTPANMTALMQKWKAGEEPKAFNQNHVQTCEGPLGKTSLTEEVDAFANFRDLGALAGEIAAEEAAKKDAA